MKINFTFLIIILVLPVCLHAQSKFTPGSVVTLKGDTLKGLIDQKEWGENPDRISFKQNEQSAITRYTPTDISAFRVTGEDYFITYTGPISKGAIDLADLSSGIDSSTVQNTVFLRIVASGKKFILYSYSDRIKNRYFLSQTGSTPFELNRYVFLDIERVNRTVEINAYQQQLNNLVSVYQPGNVALMEKVLDTPYKLNDLEEIIAAIEGSQQITTVLKKRSGQRFFIGAGADFNQFSFVNSGSTNTTAPDIFSSTEKIASVAPVINGGIDLFFNKDVQKLALRMELGLTMRNFSASYTNTRTDYITVIGREDHLSFKQYTAILSPQLIYNIYNQDRFKFYLNGGFQFHFSALANNRYVGVNIVNGVRGGGTDVALRYKEMMINATAGAGVEIAKKINIYVKYGTPAAVTDYGGFGLNIVTYRAGVNYLFAKK